MSVDPTVNVLSLCAGVGGLDLGIELAVRNARTVCFVEREAYCCEVLAARMEEGSLAPAPIWTDLRTFDGSAWRGVVDLVAAGYPCQPYSNAGKRLGESDPRDLWPDVCRVIEECRVPWVFLENVGAHLKRGFERTWRDLQRLGYCVEGGLFTAEEAGAPHKRERLYALAYRGRLSGQRFGGARVVEEEEEQAQGQGYQRQRLRNAASYGGQAVAHHHHGCQSLRLGSVQHGKREALRDDVDGRGSEAPFPPAPDDVERWSRVPYESQPAVCRMADGMATRMDRLRACGNGVVPQQAAYAFRTLVGRFI